MRFLDLVEKDDASSLSDLKTDEQGEDGAGGKVGAAPNARGRFARSSRRNLPFHPSDGASPAACFRCGEVCARVEEALAVVGERHQRPFAGHFGQSAQTEASEAHRRFAGRP